MSDDLTAQFGPSGRSQLAGMLPARTPPAPEPPETQKPPKAPDDTSKPKSPKAPKNPTPPKATSTPPPEAESESVDHGLELGTPDGEGTLQIPVYVLRPVLPAARQMRTDRKITNADIAYAAIDELGATLPALVEYRHNGPRRTGSRFPIRANRRGRRSGSPRVLWAIRATEEERRELENARREYGAESISELVSVAVEAYLKVTDQP